MGILHVQRRVKLPLRKGGGAKDRFLARPLLPLDLRQEHFLPAVSTGEMAGPLSFLLAGEDVTRGQKGYKSQKRLKRPEGLTNSSVPCYL